MNDMLKELEKTLNLLSLTNSERIPMEVQTRILEDVRQGNYRSVSAPILSSHFEEYGHISDDSLKLLEYYVVAMATLCCQAAIEGGVKADMAFDYSDALLHLLTECRTREDYDELGRLVPFVFAREVCKANRDESTYLLEQVKGYVHRNIYEKIYLKEVADFVGVNPNYLSGYFSKEAGMTLQEYIQKEKIEAACKLLQYSKNNVAEVSQCVGFKSQSNFSAVFRKWKKMSPSEYRNRYYRAVY